MSISHVCMFLDNIGKRKFSSKTSIANLAGKLSFSRNVYICIFELLFALGLNDVFEHFCMTIFHFS